MGKSKKVQEKVGLKDIVAFARAGWTPGDVNAILDRMDEIGDINDPDDINDPEGDDVDDDTTEEKDTSNDTTASGEGEPDEDEEDDDTDDTDQKDTSSQKKATNKSTLLESENTRLKNEIAKLQAKNRSKDISGGNKVSLEQSLIDTFQSLFD